MVQLMPLPPTVSCFSKIQIGFTFLVPADPGSPGQRAVKRVCLCVSVCVQEYFSCGQTYFSDMTFLLSVCFSYASVSKTMLLRAICTHRFVYLSAKSCIKHMQKFIHPYMYNLSN